MARQADDAPVEEPDGARVDARGEETSRGASPLPIGAAPSFDSLVAIVREVVVNARRRSCQGGRALRDGDEA